VQDCGIQSEVCGAVVAALRRLPALRDLQMGLRRAPPRADSEALALACAGLTRLTALDVYFAPYAPANPPVPAWRQLSALGGLRRLHACAGLGWEVEALAAVAGAATALRRLTLTDNSSASVCCAWLAALSGLGQLSRLELNSCGALEPAAVAHLHALTALTALEAFRRGAPATRCWACRQTTCWVGPPRLPASPATPRQPAPRRRRRCPALAAGDSLERLRGALPCLASLSVHE
jgi:hypothetical protein